MKKQDSHNTNDTYLAKWLAGDITDEQLKDLVSETDFKAFQKLKKGIDAYAGFNAETETTFTKIEERISNSQPKVRPLNSNRWWIGIAASIVFLFGLFYIFNDDVVSIETHFGEKKTVALLDGSEVVLNSKSTISYNEEEWHENRSLTLQGEAYFKVEKGRKFTVHTENGSVEVLGTQFNVNTTSDLFEVVCYEGKVRVASQNESVDLLPSNSVRRIDGNALERWSVAEVNPSWIHGESTFKSVPLRYVITALESEYNVTIHTEQAHINTIFTGSFPHDNLNIALQSVFRSLDIPYNEKEKGHIHLGVK